MAQFFFTRESVYISSTHIVEIHPAENLTDCQVVLVTGRTYTVPYNEETLAKMLSTD